MISLKRLRGICREADQRKNKPTSLDDLTLVRFNSVLVRSFSKECWDVEHGLHRETA